MTVRLKSFSVIYAVRFIKSRRDLIISRTSLQRVKDSYRIGIGRLA